VNAGVLFGAFFVALASRPAEMNTRQQEERTKNKQTNKRKKRKEKKRRKKHKGNKDGGSWFALLIPSRHSSFTLLFLDTIPSFRASTTACNRATRATANSRTA